MILAAVRRTDLKDSTMEPDQIGTIAIHHNNLNETEDAENGKVVDTLLRQEVNYIECSNTLNMGE